MLQVEGLQHGHGAESGVGQVGEAGGGLGTTNHALHAPVTLQRPLECSSELGGQSIVQDWIDGAVKNRELL